MRLDSLRVELRPRSPWEAVELGTALVRKHASAIWMPWLLLSLPVFAVVNALAWAIDAVWLAWLLMWWLKPAFDRIPLFVVSRALFGDAPSVRQTLAAQLRWGWRAMLGYLTWRRLSPVRALTLPIDLLEGADRSRLGERRRVLGDAVRGYAIQLTFVCLCFTLVLALSTVLLTFVFVPDQLLGESARALWSLAMDDPPPWAQIAGNGVLWVATTFVEPFYVGAGFGLYLNRRTQIEAWDVEIAFRRLRARLDAGATTLALVVAMALMLPIAPAAQAAPQCAAPRASALQDATDQADAQPDNDKAAVEPTLPIVFGDARVEYKAFNQAVERAYRDPLLNPKRKVMEWQSRTPVPPEQIPALAWLGSIIGFIGEYGLWLLLGALLVILAMSAKRWWPWLNGMVAVAPAPSAIDVAALTLPDRLPHDIAAAARQLWAEGRPRRALALLYRASVEAMSARADVVLVPGATEAECLRASRRMADGEDRNAFARVVRVWQYAAYAQRLPDQEEFDALLGTLSERFHWAGAAGARSAA